MLEQQRWPVLPLVDEGLGNSSYVVDLGDGRGLVVDPERHPGRYLAVAARSGLGLAYAVETHLHADFVSGASELAALGATVIGPARAGHEFPVRGLRHGDHVDLGGLALHALATPGHTPEHLAYLLLDGVRPVALFSGGSLLVGAVARTDLIDPDRTERLARDLWRSLHEQVLTLPDDLPVYPTHGAGSFCSAPTGGRRVTTIGQEKAANPLLGAPDEDAFVAMLLGGLGSYPPYFLRLSEANRRGPAVHGPGPPALPRLAVDHVRRLADAGAWVVDARPVEAFARGHVPGSVSIALRPQFATWLGWLVPPDAPVVTVLERGQDRSEVLRQARNIGYDAVIGELDGGVDAWAGAGLAIAPMDVAPVTAAEGTIVDVRQVAEYRSGHLPGALHLELGDVMAHARSLPAGPLALMCGHGERAMTAASLLARAGRRHLTVLTGGPADWAVAHASQLDGPAERAAGGDRLRGSSAARPSRQAAR